MYLLLRFPKIGVLTAAMLYVDVSVSTFLFLFCSRPLTVLKKILVEIRCNQGQELTACQMSIYEIN